MLSGKITYKLVLHILKSVSGTVSLFCPLCPDRFDSQPLPPPPTSSLASVNRRLFPKDKGCRNVNLTVQFHVRSLLTVHLTLSTLNKSVMA